MSKASPTVYLAGAITGLTYNEGQDWRNYARTELAGADIRAFSPLRGKDYLQRVGKIPSVQEGWAKTPEAMIPLSSNKGIVTRDRNDCTRCDLVLMNLLGTERVSIGTMIEAGWADAARNPIVLVMEDGNIHEHAMLNELAGYRVRTLDEALDICIAILAPDFV